MHLPAALERWAAEHSDQLSEDTLDEVQAIADDIAESPLYDRSIDDVDQDIGQELSAVLGGSRSERATTLVHIVATWSRKNPILAAEPVAASPEGEPVEIDSVPESDADLETPNIDRDLAAGAVDEADLLGNTDVADSYDTVDIADIADISPSVAIVPGLVPDLPPAHGGLPGTPIEAPALFGSDKVDEEDDVRLYGPRRRWRAVLGSILALAVLAGAGAGAWWWFTQRDTDPTDTTTTVAEPDAEPEATTDPEPDIVDESPTAEPQVEPTTAPTAEPAPLVPSYWADTIPILNSGSAQISASTYAVSPANRAVLTGHTAAITGIVVSDAGRVLTAGADRRLVDWGSDVTLASPDIVNVPSPLTLLIRTVDQRIIAGDSTGNITILDLVNTADPVVLPVHGVAISAAAELADGRLAVASVDGEVTLFDVATPEDTITLSHDLEVTGVVGLPDGRIATAAVDGIVRLWSGDGSDEPEAPDEIDTLQSPITALTLLEDGQLATASVDGAIHVVPAEAGAEPSRELPGHTGAIRSLLETTLPSGDLALASGGDDTTIRLWDLESGEQVHVLEGHGDIISGLAALPDRRLVSTSGDGTGRVWDLTVAPGAPVIPPHNWNLSAITPLGNDQFVTGGVDGLVVLASTAITTQPTTITEHDAPIVGLKTLQSGDIVSLDASSLMRVSEASGAAPSLGEFTVASGATALDVRTNEGVVTGHADGSVRFHDFTEEVGRIDAHGDGVNDVTALSTGQVVSAGQDMTVKVLDPETASVVSVFDLHTAAVDVVIELPDGRVASAGSDGIYVWTLEGLSQDHVRLNGQRARTISLVALPNDRLISTGEDGRVRLWDLNTPDSEPTTLVDIPGVVNPHLIQADNGLFVAGASRGYVVFTLS